MSHCFSLVFWTACGVLRLPHKSDWASIVSALATSASTVVLLVGAFLARRYVTRVTATVEASGFTRPDGVLSIVRPCIQSAGLSRLVINQDVDTAVDVTVSEQQWWGEDFETGEKVHLQAFGGIEEEKTIVDPGEVIADSLIFFVSSATAVTLG